MQTFRTLMLCAVIALATLTAPTLAQRVNPQSNRPSPLEIVSKTVDGLDHHFEFVPQFGQLAQMVTNLSFPAVLLGERRRVDA